MDARGIAFEGADLALAVPESELRLFGKPESFAKRRMGVALARGTRCGRSARAREDVGVIGEAGKSLKTTHAALRNPRCR